jgi:methanogenic corrinoid protein MtbC1
MNEVHELGLMYLNYETLLHGYKTIYLGESMPIEDLMDLKKHFKSIVFVSYLTVQPDKDTVNDYLKRMIEVLMDENTELWYVGRMTEFIKKDGLPDSVKVFNSITDLIEHI